MDLPMIRRARLEAESLALGFELAFSRRRDRLTMIDWPGSRVHLLHHEVMGCSDEE